MSDLLKRIADYFTNDYQGDDKTAPTMEITVNDLRYIASMNVDRCRAEAELRNIKQGGVGTDDVCEWKIDGVYLHSPHNRPFVTCISDDEDYRYNYCPVCGKKIKAVE